MLFEEVGKFPSNSDLVFETNFHNRAEKFVYLERYKLTYYLILDNVTCQGLLNYSFLLNDG